MIYWLIQCFWGNPLRSLSVYRFQKGSRNLKIASRGCGYSRKRSSNFLGVWLWIWNLCRVRSPLLLIHDVFQSGFWQWTIPTLFHVPLLFRLCLAKTFHDTIASESGLSLPKDGEYSIASPARSLDIPCELPLRFFHVDEEKTSVWILPPQASQQSP